MAVPLLELFGMKGYQQLVGKFSHMMDQPITLDKPDHVTIMASFHQTASLRVRYIFCHLFDAEQRSPCFYTVLGT